MEVWLDSNNPGGNRISTDKPLRFPACLPDIDAKLGKFSALYL